MEIRIKKQLNLPQLIEWGFKNDITNQYFIANDTEEYTSEVFFDVTGLPQFSSMVDKHDTFTVETFEEITEDTVFEKLLEIRGSGTIYPHYLEAINDEMDDFSKEFHACIDGEFKLIWRDGKLVE